MANIRTKIELDQLREALLRLEPDRILRAMFDGLRVSMGAMVRDVVDNKMLGQYLGVVTGTARRSMRDRTVLMRDRVVGVFGSKFGYVRAHELGFQGTVRVPGHSVRGHTQKVPAHEVRSHTRRDGTTIRAHSRKAHTRTIRAHSRLPHTRQVNIRARRFMRDTLREQIPPTEERVLRALERLARGV